MRAFALAALLLSACYPDFDKALDGMIGHPGDASARQDGPTQVPDGGAAFSTCAGAQTMFATLENPGPTGDVRVTRIPIEQGATCADVVFGIDAAPYAVTAVNESIVLVAGDDHRLLRFNSDGSSSDDTESGYAAIDAFVQSGALVVSWVAAGDLSYRLARVSVDGTDYTLAAQLANTYLHAAPLPGGPATSVVLMKGDGAVVVDLKTMTTPHTFQLATGQTFNWVAAYDDRVAFAGASMDDAKAMFYALTLQGSFATTPLDVGCPTDGAWPDPADASSFIVECADSGQLCSTTYSSPACTALPAGRPLYADAIGLVPAP